MRPATIAFFMLALDGCSPHRAAPIAQGNWQLIVCEGSVSKGSTCAFLYPTLKLEVHYSPDAGAVGDVLFTNTVSETVAHTLVVRGYGVIQSFDITHVPTYDRDLSFFSVRLSSGLYEASVHLPLAYALDTGSNDMRALGEQLREITHAF